MQLNLFEKFALLDEGGGPVRVPLKRSRALLAYLALKENRSESRETIVDMLWPDRFRKQALSSLRQVLFEVGKLTDGEPLLVATRDEVGLGPAITSCDVWTFWESVNSHSADDAEDALRLYRGPFLDGPPLGPESFQQWAAIQRTRFEGQLDRAVLAAADEHGDAVSLERSLTLLDELLRLNPMCAQAMMRILEIEVSRQNVAEALQRYQRYARRLKIEYDDEPPAELRDAVEALKTSAFERARLVAPKLRPAAGQLDPWRKTSVDAPVVAVLPFRYLGNDETGSAVTLALCEDVTLMLSGCKWFSVLSRAATHSLVSDSAFIPRDFVSRTGADYLVYGSVIGYSAKWSINIELADAENGLITWAKRYDTDADNLIRSPQELCQMIVAALDPAIAESEQNALARPTLAATGSLAAYRQLIVGYRHYYAGRWTEALDAFRAATAEDATYAHAYAMMAITQYYIAQIERKPDWREGMREAEKLARRALEIDPSEAKACVVLGLALDWQGIHDETEELLDRAASRNPSFASASTARAYHAVMTGQYEAAETYMQTALRLRVGDKALGFCLPAKALAHLHLNQVGSALEAAHWAARMKPDFWLVGQVLAAALLESGNEKGARDAVEAMRRRYRGLGGAEFAAWFPYDRADVDAPVTRTFRHFGWI